MTIMFINLVVIIVLLDWNTKNVFVLGCVQIKDLIRKKKLKIKKLEDLSLKMLEQCNVFMYCTHHCLFELGLFFYVNLYY